MALCNCLPGTPVLLHSTWPQLLCLSPDLVAFSITITWMAVFNHIATTRFSPSPLNYNYINLGTMYLEKYYYRQEDICFVGPGKLLCIDFHLKKINKDHHNIQTLLDRSFPSDIHAIVLTENNCSNRRKFDFSDAVCLITLATFSVLAYMFSWWSLPYTSKRQKQKSWKSNDFLTRFITTMFPLPDFKCSHGFASWSLFLIVNSEKKNTIGEKGLI